MGRFYLNKENRVLQYIILMFGTFLMAVSTIMFFEPMEIVVGGVTGVAIILKKLFGIPMWFVSAAINIPLFVAGWRMLDRKTFVRTLTATFTLTLFLGIVPEMKVLTGDTIVDITIGAVLMGAGLGLVFLQYASSGGSDLLATIINVRVKHISIPKIMAIIDAVIVILGTGIFGITSGIYSLIAICIVTKVSDIMVEGPDRAKLIYIITGKEKQISDYIINDINRGVTYIETTGAYTQKIRKMIMCVVSGKEMVKIKQKVYQIDENAICFVGDIREAFGEGFTKFRG